MSTLMFWRRAGEDLENQTAAQLRFGPDTKSQTFPLTRCILFQGIVCFTGSLVVLDVLGLVSTALNNFDSDQFFVL